MTDEVKECFKLKNFIKFFHFIEINLVSAEVFPQNARSSAMALVTLVNWILALVLTLGFPFFVKTIGQYVFLVFVVLLGLVLFILTIKVRIICIETNNHSLMNIIFLI